MKNITDIEIGETFNYTTPDGDQITATLRDNGLAGGCEFDAFVAFQESGYTDGLEEVATFDSADVEISQ